MAALQNRVDGLWTGFTARDDPLQRAQIAQDRLDAISELEHTRGEIDRYEQEITDIQEEARRAGARPAGSDSPPFGLFRLAARGERPAAFDR